LIVGASSPVGDTGWSIAINPTDREDREIMDRLVGWRAEAVRNKQTGEPLTDDARPGPARGVRGDRPRHHRDELGWFGQTGPGGSTPGLSM
jgi:hypothetical protein